MPFVLAACGPCPGCKIRRTRPIPISTSIFFPFLKMMQGGLLRDRLMAALSGFFGALATLLEAIGLYGHRCVYLRSGDGELVGGRGPGEFSAGPACRTVGPDGCV